MQLDLGVMPIALESSSPQVKDPFARRTSVLACVLFVAGTHAGLSQTAPAAAEPKATLVPAAALTLTGAVDSNSPAVWDLRDGVQTLQVITSFDGRPSLSTGQRLGLMGPAEPVQFVSHPGDGLWMESVIVDEGGTWYGFYHNEVPATMCDGSQKVMPRIGAARSSDEGETWENLGIVLEAPPFLYDCQTSNKYFVGGVGDVDVLRDRDSKDLYLFFSQYSRPPEVQGVAVARLAWADRDQPTGKVQVWVNGIWRPASNSVTEDADGVSHSDWIYPAGSPLVPVTLPWHDADLRADGFWGPSVHWNTAIQQYVMLLNRAKDEQFTQEGIYVSFAPVLDDPTAWTAPQKLMDGGDWYPQVMGVESGSGSDKQAAAVARFFVNGKSHAYITFALR